MIAWVLLLFSAIYAFPAFAYFGPSVDSDEITTSAQGGSGFFLQTVSATDHFEVNDESPRGYLLNEQAPAVSQELTQEKQRQRELLNLSWMVGYAYYRSSADDPASGALIHDEAHAVKLGLAWEAGGLFDLTAAAAYQVMPAENYSQGIYDLNADFIIPLVSEHELRVPGSPQDASVYYQNQELASEQLHLPAVSRFPHLKVGVQAEIEVHTKSPTTTGRSAGSTLSGDQTLNVSATGPEIVLNVSPRLKFRLAAMFYEYGSPPSEFLAGTTIGGNRPKADLALADFEGTSAYLLLFPARTYSGAATFWFNRAVNASLILEGATYNATGTAGAGLLSSTFDTGVVLDWAFAPRWKIGALLDYTTGSASYGETTGGLQLGFAL